MEIRDNAIHFHNVGRDTTRRRLARTSALRRSSHRLSQFFEKQSRALEISSLESLRKPGIDRFQQIACISTATLGVLQPSKAHCGAQFPRQSLLPTRQVPVSYTHLTL